MMHVRRLMYVNITFPVEDGMEISCRTGIAPTA
jgi:hypothetical protein